MYVAPTNRREGVARVHPGWALSVARERGGIEIVQLSVSSANTAVQRLYAEAGFSVFGEEPVAVLHEGNFLSKTHTVACHRLVGR